MRKKKDAGIRYRAPEPSTTRIEDARVAYVAVPPDEDEEEEAAMSATTRLSAKNQITLPAAMVRQLGLRAGDEIDLLAVENHVTLERRPRTPEEWVARLAGAMTHVPEWGSDEQIHAWVRGERESWDREWDKE